MKTTLDLPDELMRRVKVRAAQSDRKLKDTVAQLLESGLRDAQSAPLDPPVPRKLRRRGPLTIADIEAAIATGRQ